MNWCRDFKTLTILSLCISDNNCMVSLMVERRLEAPARIYGSLIALLTCATEFPLIQVLDFTVVRPMYHVTKLQARPLCAVVTCTSDKSPTSQSDAARKRLSTSTVADLCAAALIQHSASLSNLISPLFHQTINSTAQTPSSPVHHVRRHSPFPVVSRNLN